MFIKVKRRNFIKYFLPFRGGRGASDLKNLQINCLDFKFDIEMKILKISLIVRNFCYIINSTNFLKI